MNDLEKLDLVGLSNLAERWKVTRQRVQAMTKQHGFPEPVIQMKAPSGKITHRLWSWKATSKWRERQMRGR